MQVSSDCIRGLTQRVDMGRETSLEGCETKFLSLGPDVIVTFFNPFRPEFTIVIFIHYKPQIAVAILEL